MKRLLLIMLAICTLASCGTGNGDDTPKNIKVTGGKTTQEVFADNTHGEDAVNFTTTGAWTSSIVSITKVDTPDQGEDAVNFTTTGALTSSIVSITKVDTPDWISIDPASGDKAGDYTINISLIPNDTGENRKAEIKISCDGTVITITIEQKGTIEGDEKPEPKLAQVSKTIYTSKSDEDTGEQPEVTEYTYDNNGRIILMTQQYQVVDEVGVDGKPGKVTDHKKHVNLTYEGNNVKYKLSSTEGDETEGTAKLNAKGYVESSVTEDYTYQMSYNSDWQIDRVTEVGDSESINICRWSNGNLTTLVWGTNGEETATYSSYPNNKINLDINWLLLQNLEGFAFLDGSGAENSFYAIQNMLGVRSKNYVSEIWANYTWSGSIKVRGFIFEYEFNNEGLPIKIKQYYGQDSSVPTYNGSITIEYNKL